MAHFEDRDVDYTREADQEDEEDEGPVVEHYVDAALEAYWWSWGEHYCKFLSSFAFAAHTQLFHTALFNVMTRYQFCSIAKNIIITKETYQSV